MRKYSYDNNGKIDWYMDYTDVLTNSSHFVKKVYTYDSFDRVSTMNYYDSSNLSKAVESYAYQYNKNSQITNESITYNYDTVKTTEQKTYRYDSIGQLDYSKVVKDGTTTETTYQYDDLGNRLRMTQNGVVTDYVYNELNQLESSKSTDTETNAVISDITYLYTSNGQLMNQCDVITGEYLEFTYDVKGQLISSQGTKEGKLTFSQTNTYNGEGKRIRKVENDVITNYYYQGDHLLYTTDGTDNITSYNYFGLTDNILATTRYDGDKTTYYLYNKDIHGSTSNIVTSTGTSAKGYTYDDFGKPTTYGSSTFYNEITYTGAIYDDSTGLYYMSARYYDPDTGRFISQDTYRGEAKDSGTWNLYVYCASDPINYVDPTGHWKLPNWAKVVVGAVATVGAVAVTVATGGAAAPLLIGVAASTLSGAAIGYLTGGKQGMIDGAADGFMWGGIGAFASSSVSAVKALKTAKQGITIGEKMGRVRKAAQVVDSRVYKAMKGYKAISIISPKLANKMSLAHNKAFITRMTKLGAAIYDIGPKDVSIASKWYSMERQVVKGYFNYVKMY